MKALEPVLSRIAASRLVIAVLTFPAFFLLAACGGEKKAAPPMGPVEVTVLDITPRDVPQSIQFVGTTESSHQVEIRSRVEGFLEKRSYEEGGRVKAGQVMFQIDRRPFEATLQQARGELAQQEAKLATAVANLNRVRPLAERNAVSKKDLDDAIGQEQSSRAAVLSAQGKVRDAELKLSYTTIQSPIDGYAGKAEKQEGSYISMGSDSLLTYVAKLDPIWVNFSVSENENLRLRDAVKKGILREPPGQNYEVEVLLADGSVFPNRGRLSFADPSYNQQTGTFEVRAVIDNPMNRPAVLRPGEFVRVSLKGATRPDAILVPRRAVMQGARGHFAWVAAEGGKAELRGIVIGEWYGDDVFVHSGLGAGDRLIVDNLIKLSPGVPIRIVEPAAKAGAAGGGAARQAPAAAAEPQREKTAAPAGR
jgi:membrane fusion protein (multidrug efflux system)